MRQKPLAAMAALALAACATPPAPTHAQIIPFTLDNNLIFVPVSVNGGAPLSFALDTGAYSMLDEAHARAANIPLHRIGQTDGIGANQKPVYAFEGATLTLAA